jgi:hypothetical protein
VDAVQRHRRDEIMMQAITIRAAVWGDEEGFRRFVDSLAGRETGPGDEIDPGEFFRRFG